MAPRPISDGLSLGGSTGRKPKNSNVSAPAPPDRVSAPSPPRSVSAPSPAEMLSLPEVPTRESAPGEPTMVAAGGGVGGGGGEYGATKTFEAEMSSSVRPASRTAVV